MKKFLLFLLLFAAGVSVLKCIETPVATDVDPPRVEPRRPTESDLTLEEESRLEFPTGEESDTGISVQIQGAARYSKRVEEGPFRGRKLYNLESVDSRSLAGGTIELIDLVAIAYDPESDEELVRIVAGRGRASAKDVFGEDILLTDVELTLLRNAPIVPLVLRAPTLVCSLSERHFSTDERVQIEGQGLVASGTGFEFVVAEGLMRFVRDGFAEVALEAGKTSTLVCDGAFEIQRSARGTGPVFLDATDDARLSLSGKRPIELSADHLRVSGRSTDGESSALGFEEVEAEGHVSLAMTGNEFRSERARVELLGRRNHFRAVMEGAPNGRFSFARRIDPEGSASETPAAAPFVIRYGGAGPLVVNRRDEVSFQLEGASVLEWTDAVLQAADNVSGTFGPGVDEAVFSAFGDVRIRREGGLLETDQFRMRHVRDAAGESLVTASASAPALISGRADEEHLFELSASREVEFAMEGRHWKVPRAGGIELTVDGPRGFVARANEVAGLSTEPLALEAVGEVSLDSEWGQVTGERLVLEGLEEVAIDGTPERLAHVRSERGEWYALRLERRGPRMIAEMVERATFRDALGLFELGCDRMVIEEHERESERGAGITARGFEVEATGSIAGRAEYPDETFELACESLLGSWTEHLRGEEFLFSESRLVASREVDCDFVRADTTYRLQSETLEIDRTNRGTDSLTSGNLVARGNVHVASQGRASLNGRGDRLEIDKYGRGELIAEGENRVHADGVMPEGRFPFEMTATRLLFSETLLEADWPELEFRLGEADERLPSQVFARATARSLEARGETLTLDGGVDLRGVNQDLAPWTLSADRAQIDVRRTGGPGLLGSLEAKGSVEFHLEGTMHARGDEFQVKSAQRRVRVEGSPARVLYGGLDFESDWIEYDLLIHAISSAKGSVIRPILGESDFTPEQ